MFSTTPGPAPSLYISSPHQQKDVRHSTPHISSSRADPFGEGTPYLCKCVRQNHTTIVALTKEARRFNMHPIPIHGETLAVYVSETETLLPRDLDTRVPEVEKEKVL
ncbi:hypothetical protein AVEN_237247-1 [Araneus ventricosus]|uniref:Uncharacterized protein n=1 Tax=Araneus ventricosus TaxID=182803 RepID=A0A4Y2Q637_ARAVE|nr:hypothetical protein AVEN_237247-1 [Araneus ventricosus]